MGAIVFASTWGKYHFNRQCSGLRAAQDLSDWDCWDGDHCRHDHPRPSVVKRMSDTKARLDGKQPCLKCVPQHLRTFDNTGDTHGHEPVDEYADRPGITRIVCARCITWTPMPSVGLQCGRRVDWPCTSAIVLGLAPR